MTILFFVLLADVHCLNIVLSTSTKPGGAYLRAPCFLALAAAMLTLNSGRFNCDYLYRNRHCRWQPSKEGAGS